MTPIIALILGLLIGWLVEWVIDWVYWRRRYQALKDAGALCQQNLISLDRELVSVKAANAQAKQEVQALQAELASSKQGVQALQGELTPSRQEAQALREKVAQIEPEKGRLEGLVSRLEQELGELRARLAALTPPVPDDLEAIRGIGPVIAKKLNQAGVYTFEQLAAQTPDWLRKTLGTMIERLADEDALIEQARQFAERKARQK